MTVHELKQIADQMGYAVRLKGHKRVYRDAVRHDGTPVLDFFHPHLQMRASEYARTKKVYAQFKKQIKAHFGRELKTDSEVYRFYMLLLMEHCAREMKITGEGVFVVLKLMLPLPREEWLKPRRKKCIPSKVDK